MHVPAPPKKVFFRDELGPILHTTPSYVSLAMAVPPNGSEHVPLTVEWPSQKQQQRQLGKHRQKLQRKNGENSIQEHNFLLLGTNSNGLKAKKAS